MILSSTAARITLIFSAIALILLTTGIGMMTGAVPAIIMFVLGSLYALLLVYDVACTIEGGCNIYGLFKTFLIAIYSIVIVLLSIGMIFIKSKLTALSKTAAAKPVAQKPAGQ